MKISSPNPNRIDALELMVRDLAHQHQVIAINHAELLKMILQLQLQIDELAEHITPWSEQGHLGPG